MRVMPVDPATHWAELLKHPVQGDHIVQVYQDDDFLADAVGEYLAQALHHGEAAVAIATADHREAFVRRMKARGAPVQPALRSGQLTLLDAEETLAVFAGPQGVDRKAFDERVGAVLAQARLQYPTLRVYGEMVNVLWERGEQALAIELERLWETLAAEQGFSVFCAYRMDPLRRETFEALESVCRVHSHLIPARDYRDLNRTVVEASKKVLDQPLAQMLLAMSSNERPPASMPLGQAVLLWLNRNMPRTAERVLREVRALRHPASARAASSPAFSTAPRTPRG